MTCRVSLLQDNRPKAPVSCADCGARDMEVELAIGLREEGYGVWQG